MDYTDQRESWDHVGQNCFRVTKKDVKYGCLELGGSNMADSNLIMTLYLSGEE